MRQECGSLDFIDLGGKSAEQSGQSDQHCGFRSAEAELEAVRGHVASVGPGREKCHAQCSTREFYSNWEQAADDIVAILRQAAGRDPYDKDLTDLVGELSTRSEEFRTRWARHDARYHRTGRKRIHHPIVGDLDLAFEALELPGEPGLRVNVYTADPGTPSEDALKLLASWAATQREIKAAQSATVPISDSQD